MLTIKQIRSKISGVRTSTKKLRANIQTILINIAAHAYMHGDVTQYDSLMDACSGVNRKRIALWVRKYGFAVLDRDGKFKSNSSARKNAQFNSGEECVAELTSSAPMWYESEESMPQVAKAIDIAGRIELLTNQVAAGEKEFTVDFVGIQEAVDKLLKTVADAVTAQKLADELEAA